MAGWRIIQAIRDLDSAPTLCGFPVLATETGNHFVVVCKQLDLVRQTVGGVTEVLIWVLKELNH